MWEQSNRIERIVAVGAVAGALAIAGVAATGCGSDSNSNDVNKAIDSIQSQANSVQSQISSAATNAEQQAQSVKSQVQSQVQSVQSQIQTQTQSNGGSGGSNYGY
jgi:cob(I)alamin adenosyltransferase